VYEPATPLDLDEPLIIEPDAARLLAESYGLGAQALSRFAAGIPGDKPSPAVLWPEHFDIGLLWSAARAQLPSGWRWGSARLSRAVIP
jgi:hypothetical protein